MSLLSLPACGESAPAELGSRAAAPEPADLETFAHALGPRLSRSSAGLVKEKTAHGGTRIDLRGRFQNVSVVHVKADGAAETACVTSESELAGVLDRVQKGRAR